MQSATQTPAISGKRIWTGRIISALAALFLLFDGVTKVMRVKPVMDAFAQLGYPGSLAPVIGIILLVCLAVYVIPRTSILGAILLTGYLGAATSTHVRVGNLLFETLFPIIFGALIWVGIYLRDDRLRALVPLRS